MALTEVGNLHTNVAHDLALDSTATQISNATVLYAMEIDNTANTEAIYAKLWENGSPTVGTTPPEEIYRIPAGQKVTVTLGGAGHQFATDIYVAAVTTGGTSGSTSPTNSVPARFWTD